MPEAENSLNDQEPQTAAVEAKAEPAPAAEQIRSKPAVQDALDSLFLKEDDLKNEAVARMVLNKMTTLERENLELRKTKDVYHESDKECAVTKTELTNLRRQARASQLIIALGGALVSLGGFYYEKNSGGGVVVFCIGLALIYIPFAKSKGEN